MHENPCPEVRSAQRITSLWSLDLEVVASLLQLWLSFITFMVVPLITFGANFITITVSGFITFVVKSCYIYS